MNNQEILNQLSGIECALYYRADGSDDPEGISFDDLKKAHLAARALLEFWHNVTGATLDPTAK